MYNISLITWHSFSSMRTVLNSHMEFSLWRTKRANIEMPQINKSKLFVCHYKAIDECVSVQVPVYVCVWRC